MSEKKRLHPRTWLNFDYLYNMKYHFYFSKYRPNHTISKLSDIQNVANINTKGIIFDVDQTLLSYKSDSVDQATLLQLQQLRQKYQCCLLSNFHKNPFQTNRLGSISEQIGIPLVQTKNKKPSPKAFTAALNMLNLQADEVLMVGDRILTDIVGANLTGIRSIYKKPINTGDDPILLVTIPRLLENIVLSIVKRI